MRTSSVVQKVGASTVNCGLVLALTAPLYPLVETEQWKITTVLTFLIYNLIFRERCIGMWIVKTYPIDRPTSPLYATLYTMGFSTFFFYVVFPLDLLILNTVAQIGSILMTGNTLHALVAGQGTIDRDQYVTRAKQSALLLVEVGELWGAVQLMDRAMSRYSDLKVWPEVVDVGKLHAMANDTVGVRGWIEGF